MTGFARRVLRPFEGRDLTSLPFNRGPDLLSPNTKSGRKVTDDIAMTLSAVYGAVRILSDGVATLPVKVTRGDGAAAEPVEPPPFWVREPSSIWSPIDIRTQIMVSILHRGNAYVATIRDPAGAVIELVPLDPQRVTPKIVAGRLVWEVAGHDEVLTARDCLHIRGLVKPGDLKGMAPLDYAAESVGLGLAAQDFGAAHFGNGALPGAVLETESQMSPEGAKLWRRTWNDLHKGPNNANKIALLTEGANLKTIGVSPEQSQFLGTREFQVSDIARFFGVPPHLLQDATGSTSWGSGLAEQTVNYVTHSLRPWVERIEDAFTRLARSEPQGVGAGVRDPLFVSLRMDHLLRGDFSSRISTYGLGLDRGIWNLDEVRAMEGLPAIPDDAGQAHRAPLSTGDVADDRGNDDDA